MGDVRADVEQLKNDLTDGAGDALEKVVTFTRERPHIAVGIALSAGWILGNGLHPRLALGATQLAYKALLGGVLAQSGLLRTLGIEEEEEDREEAPAGPQASPGARRASPEGKVGPRRGSAVKE